MEGSAMSEQALRHTINVEACWVEQAVERNPIRQLVIPSGHMALNVDAAGRWTAEDRLGRRWPVYPRGERYEGWDLSVRATTRAAAWEAGQVPDGTWLGGRELSTPSEVLSSYTGAFSFVAEDATAGIKGLRRPQVGALHSVLGYWTTGRSDPATVVMPTGTGKTEAMLALLVAARIRRLVVVVPSDALRTQIASKFEALGLLQEFRVVAVSAIRPVVGQLHHGLRDVESACMMAKACNVIVTTPGALAASQPAARMSLLDECSHMFVDEAHHVPAATWNTLRDAMKPRPVVQFTATPYREDGRVLGGRLLYAFPLKEAQADGYFAGINYVSVIDFADPDRAVASRAVNQLRSDLTAGYDHLLMARVRYQGRAEALLELYEELASDLGPVVLHSGLPRRDRDAAKDSLDSRASRIVICVDMLGEGFDLPALKVAALHDPHRSLGVSLQFIGRFTRVGDASLGDATAVAARPERAYDPHLRALYAEDADWNVVISDLSEAEVEAQQELSDFESSFGAQPDDVTLRNLEPKMSTVVYRTRCDHWQPERVVEVFPEPALLTYPIAVNVRHRVAWFVTTEITPVRWGNLRTVEEVRHHLYVLYWDAERQLLYINSSDTDSVYPDLAKAVAGDDVERVTGENIYRVMANLARLVPTNIGVLDTRSRSRRFSMHVGADVSEGFPQAEAQTKTKTNIFATGYAEGDRVTIGASLKGRIWSHRAARTIPEWMAWCDHVGRKVTDPGISVDDVMRGFIRPTVVDSRPPFVPLALEWPWQLYSVSEEVKVSLGGRVWPLIDTELIVTRFVSTGSISFEVRTPKWSSPYSLHINNGALTYTADDGEVSVLKREQSTPLAAFLDRFGPTVLFTDDVMMVPPGLLLQPPRDIPPFDPSLIASIDWAGDGVDIRKESQGPDRDPASIQARAIRLVKDEAEWTVLLDDDGTGEVADIVSLRVEGDELLVGLTHCKYSSEDQPGARILDLYELCGQAQKSVRWRRDVILLFEHLIRRERKRQLDGRTGFELGDAAALYDLQDRSRLLRPRLEITIVQPGVSADRVSDSQLELLASTELYVRETANASLRVITSP